MIPNEIQEEIAAGRRKASKSAAWNCARNAASMAGLPFADIPADGNYPDFAALEQTIASRLATCVIVSRHAATIDWLVAQGIVGDVVTHIADPAQIAGRHVIGNVPLFLAAVATKVTVVEFPQLPSELRGKELTAAQMEKYAQLSSYRVERV